MVEHCTENAGVIGSNPIGGTLGNIGKWRNGIRATVRTLFYMNVGSSPTLPTLVSSLWF